MCLLHACDGNVSTNRKCGMCAWPEKVNLIRCKPKFQPSNNSPSPKPLRGEVACARLTPTIRWTHFSATDTFSIAVSHINDLISCVPQLWNYRLNEKPRKNAKLALKLCKSIETVDKKTRSDLIALYFNTMTTINYMRLAPTANEANKWLRVEPIIWMWFERDPIVFLMGSTTTNCNIYVASRESA